MIVTPFGDLEWGDEDGLQDWLDAHDQQHYAERQAIAFSGIPLYPRSFEGPMDREWFGRHMIEHRAFQNFATPDDSISPTLIEMNWDREANFYMWHQQHNLLHSKLDQALGLNNQSAGANSTLGAL